MSLEEVLLRAILAREKQIKTVRVSSAQARGIAKEYAYWGAVRYNIVLGRKNMIINRPLEKASSHRRSKSLAYVDALHIAYNEKRIILQTIGKLEDKDIGHVIGEWQKLQ